MKLSVGHYGFSMYCTNELGNSIETVVMPYQLIGGILSCCCFYEVVIQFKL